MRCAIFSWRHRWAVHLRSWWADARVLGRQTLRGFHRDHGTQLAAGIAYYVLFSIFPLSILAVAVSGLLLTDREVRTDVVNEIFDVLPLSEADLRADLERAVDRVSTSFSVIGLVSFVGLVWSASLMMGAVRYALNQVWGVEARRSLVWAKVVDLLMVTVAGVLMGLSIGTTLLLQVARRLSADVSEFLGPLGIGATAGMEVVAVLIPLAVSFFTFLFVYKVVPSVETRWRDLWPGALFAAVLFEVVKNGFALYLQNFNNYDAVFGSFGAVVAFLLLVYLSANVLLLGAEMAAVWPRVFRDSDDEPAAAPRGVARGRGVVPATATPTRQANPPPSTHTPLSHRAQSVRRPRTQSRPRRGKRVHPGHLMIRCGRDRDDRAIQDPRNGSG